MLRARQRAAHVHEQRGQCSQGEIPRHRHSARSVQTPWRQRAQVAEGAGAYIDRACSAQEAVVDEPGCAAQRGAGGHIQGAILCGHATREVQRSSHDAEGAAGEAVAEVAARRAATHHGHAELPDNQAAQRRQQGSRVQRQAATGAGNRQRAGQHQRGRALWRDGHLGAEALKLGICSHVHRTVDLEISV